MATDRPLEPAGTIEHQTTRTGRWLRVRRIRFALWIAVVEGVIVAFLHDVSRWTVIAIAIPLLAIYLFWGRHASSDTAPPITGIAGPPPAPGGAGAPSTC